MKRAKRIYILLGVLAVVCVAAFAVIHYQEKQEEIQTSGETILSVDPDAVQSLVGRLTVTPAFVIAKGGITSSDIGVRALRVRRALVTRMVASVPRSFSPATDSSVMLMQLEKMRVTTRKGSSPPKMVITTSDVDEKSYCSPPRLTSKALEISPSYAESSDVAAV